MGKAKKKPTKLPDVSVAEWIKGKTYKEIQGILDMDLYFPFAGEYDYRIFTFKPRNIKIYVMEDDSPDLSYYDKEGNKKWVDGCECYFTINPIISNVKARLSSNIVKVGG